ncbi:MAG: transglycosylase SLT domain-containing protein [Pseudomonadota bacterium]|nr:transglycosylase SLT domain-containing protein [Pseudomonadota bacterium]
MADSEETVFVPAGVRAGDGAPPVDISYPSSDGAHRSARFTRAFVIGRGEDCALRIADRSVSRHHLAIFPENGQWWARDMKSSNGTLLNGQPIDRLPLAGTTTLELGSEGPRVRIVAPKPVQQPEEQLSSLKQVSKHYFDARQEGPAGEHTMLIRRAFKDIKRRQSRTYLAFIATVVLLLAAVGGVAVFQHLQLEKTSELANDIFYAMKELELQIANLEAGMDVAAAEALRDQIAESKRRLADMRERYDAFVEKVQTGRLFAIDSEELLILHIARVFGETEVDVPKGFVEEVRKYIKKWQSSPRLERAIQRLHQNGYAAMIYRALTSQELPPQFMYVALQETNFQPRAVGPPTRYGRAKGMWQFIPSTGKRYGLEPGPRKHIGEYDPADDRHDVEKSTDAAAKYLKDIYRTDAQASGLLVMASYNWGEGNIIKRIREMPKNPRERNFWQLLRHYKIPDETYHYVFYIFSAAVICENPRMFGFDFDNPLRDFAGRSGRL